MGCWASKQLKLNSATDDKSDPIIAYIERNGMGVKLINLRFNTGP